MSAVLGMLMLTGTIAAAEPNAALYQLQNRCEKQAAETFNWQTEDDEDRVDYRAYYNARLNKCFYAETYISPTPVGVNTWVYLSDLQEKRIYGGFHKSTNIGLFYCSLQERNATQRSSGTTLWSRTWKIDQSLSRHRRDQSFFM